MYKFGKAVVKLRLPILILALALIIPAWLGMQATRINYDMLTYLPEDIETMKGQDILMDEFGKGAFSFIVAEGMEDKDVSDLRQRIEQVPHVDSALWYDSIADLSIPKELLPDKLRDVFVDGDATMIAVFFDTSSSADETIEAITEIRQLCGKQCFVSGISALVTDLKNLCEREEPIYVGIAVLCALVAMELLTDSWLVPLVFLAGIGITILYNMGTNVFFGQISYITKALAAVLQLAVTMDYSIFLWHAYCARKKENPSREEAMALAIRDTVLSVAGSALTTIAGFLALCFMSYTMGADIGMVMAKGCLLGVLGSVTILPALILLLDKPLTATMHKSLIPDMSGVAAWITSHFWAFLVAFAVILVPATIGYFHTPVYYDFTQILSGDDVESMDAEDMQFLTAKQKLEEHFDVATTHMILCDADLPAKDAEAMARRIEKLDGVTTVLSLDSLLGTDIPADFLPGSVTKMLKSGQWQLMLINSAYVLIQTDVVDGKELTVILADAALPAAGFGAFCTVRPVRRIRERSEKQRLARVLGISGRDFAACRSGGPAVLVIQPCEHPGRAGFLYAETDKVHVFPGQIWCIHACTDVHMEAAHPHLLHDVDLFRQFPVVKFRIPCPEGCISVFAGRIFKKLIWQSRGCILMIQHDILLSSGPYVQSNSS